MTTKNKTKNKNKTKTKVNCIDTTVKKEKNTPSDVSSGYKIYLEDFVENKVKEALEKIQPAHIRSLNSDEINEYIDSIRNPYDMKFYILSRYIFSQKNKSTSAEDIEYTYRELYDKFIEGKTHGEFYYNYNRSDKDYKISGKEGYDKIEKQIRECIGSLRERAFGKIEVDERVAKEIVEILKFYYHPAFVVLRKIKNQSNRDAEFLKKIDYNDFEKEMKLKGYKAVFSNLKKNEYENLLRIIEECPKNKAYLKRIENMGIIRGIKNNKLEEYKEMFNGFGLKDFEQFSEKIKETEYAEKVNDINEINYLEFYEEAERQHYLRFFEDIELKEYKDIFIIITELDFFDKNLTDVNSWKLKDYKEYFKTLSLANLKEIEEVLERSSYQEIFKNLDFKQYEDFIEKRYYMEKSRHDERTSALEKAYNRVSLNENEIKYELESLYKLEYSKEMAGIKSLVDKEVDDVMLKIGEGISLVHNKRILKLYEAELKYALDYAKECAFRYMADFNKVVDAVEEEINEEMYAFSVSINKKEEKEKEKREKAEKEYDEEEPSKYKGMIKLKLKEVCDKRSIEYAAKVSKQELINLLEKYDALEVESIEYEEIDDYPYALDSLTHSQNAKKVIDDIQFRYEYVIKDVDGYNNFLDQSNFYSKYKVNEDFSQEVFNYYIKKRGRHYDLTEIAHKKNIKKYNKDN